MTDLTMSMFSSKAELADAQGIQIRRLEAECQLMAILVREFIRLASSQAVADEDWEIQIKEAQQLLLAIGR